MTMNSLISSNMASTLGPRSALSSIWMWAVPRLGRWRKSARGCHARTTQLALWLHCAYSRRDLGSSGAFLLTRRDSVWHYCFHDRTLLSHLRPQPAHGRWHVVFMPLCPSGDRFAAAITRWGLPRGTCLQHYPWLA